MAEQEVNLSSIGALLQIEQDARQAESEAAVEFIAANDTWRIVPYRQALLWRTDRLARPALRLASGLADLAGDSPYRQWVNAALRHLVPQLEHGKAKCIAIDALPPELHDGWREWMAHSVVLVTLPTPEGGQVGGLWLILERAPGPAELALLERLAGCYGQALWAWRKHAPAWRRAGARFGMRKRWWLALGLVALLPMRLTVLARFFVAPNQAVVAGAALFALDDTAARNRNEVAVKSRAVAEAEYLRSTQKSFSDGASKADLSSLRARLEEKTAEAQYVQDLFERIQVTAPDAGIAIFADANDWIGKPVQTGERILLLADPAKVQIAIDLAVDDALDLEPGAPVTLYLNVSPLGAVDGALTQASYEPALTAEGIVAYQLKADLAPGEAIPRIGLKGTAKLYGGWAPLIYHVVRKPLAVVRRTLGV